MRRRSIFVGVLLLAAGCNRQDAECLGRIGKLVAHQVGQLKPEAGSDLPLGRALPGYGKPSEKTDPNQSK